MALGTALKLKTLSKRVKDSYIRSKGGKSPTQYLIDAAKKESFNSDEVRHLCHLTNRAIKLHYFSSSDPKVRKMTFEVIDPQVVIREVIYNREAPLEKKASSNKIDLNVYKEDFNMEKNAGAGVSVSDIVASGYEQFDFIHDVLTKFAGEGYYKSGSIIASLRVARDKVMAKAAELEDSILLKKRELRDQQRETIDAYKKACSGGDKDEVDKIASKFGVYSKFIMDPGLHVNYYFTNDFGDLGRLEIRKDFEFKLDKIREHQDMIDKTIAIAKDYGIVTDALKKYLDNILMEGNAHKLNELIVKLEDA